MQALLESIQHLVREQHRDKITALAEKFKHGGDFSSGHLNGFFNSPSANRVLAKIISQAAALSVSGEALAGLLVGSSYSYRFERQEEEVQLVWSGPDVNRIPVRHSEQVLVELINSATRTLHLISYVLVNIGPIEEAIQSAIRRGVDVSLLIETENKDDNGSFRRTLQRLRNEIAGLRLFEWPRTQRDLSNGFASMHGKSFVGDSNVAFVTSANLTSAALDRNIEIGIWIRGGEVPTKLVQQLDAMRTANIITEIR